MENKTNEERQLYKWLAILLALIVTAVILSITLSICLPTGKSKKATDNTLYGLPESIEFSETALTSALSSGGALTVSIQAEVYPSNAINQEVDYSVAWGSGASRANENVSNYLTVTQDSDGSTKATVSCKKAFGSDKIIITVTTRDGGFTASCTASFVGKATGIDITTTQATTKTTTQRGTYYELGSNKTYTFNVELTNAINSVGTSNLSVTTAAYGQVYFGTMTSDGSGYCRFSNMTKKDISQFKDKLITASVSGTTLTITTQNCIDSFYDSREMDEFLIWYYYDRYVCEDPWDLGFYLGDTIADDYPGKSQENTQLLLSCYFTVTVRDSVSGLSKSVRMWVEQSVTSVKLTSTLPI